MFKLSHLFLVTDTLWHFNPSLSQIATYVDLSKVFRLSHLVLVTDTLWHFSLNLSQIVGK